MIELAAMTICFGCVVGITVFGAKEESEDDGSVKEIDGGMDMQVFGLILVSVNSWIYASNCVLNRALSQVQPAIVLFWHGLCGLTFAISMILVESWINDT